MNITHVVVHCSASPQGRGDTAATIHSWHKEKGWDGIGYHHVIWADGTVEQGRPHYWQGAHVKGYNHCSIGICLIGMGGDATIDQMKALKSLVHGIVGYYEMEKYTVLGHCDLDPENKPDCPGFDVKEWWEEAKKNRY